jgi:hypothetical protein
MQGLEDVRHAREYLLTTHNIATLSIPVPSRASQAVFDNAQGFDAGSSFSFQNVLIQK